MSKMFSKRLSELQRAPALQEVAGEVLEDVGPSLWGAQLASLAPAQQGGAGEGSRAPQDQGMLWEQGWHLPLGALLCPPPGSSCFAVFLQGHSLLLGCHIPPSAGHSWAALPLLAVKQTQNLSEMENESFIFLGEEDISLRAFWGHFPALSHLFLAPAFCHLQVSRVELPPGAQELLPTRFHELSTCKQSLAPVPPQSRRTTG